MHELAALGQLVTRAVLQVVTQTSGLSLARAPGEIAVLNEIGQPSVRRVRVQLDPLVSQRRCNLGRRLVGQQAVGATGKGAHDSDVLHGLLIYGIAQGFQTDPVDRRHEAAALLG